MIIRIEELPAGQKIKDISINISFEDGEIKNQNISTLPKLSTPAFPVHIDTTKTTGIESSPKITSTVSESLVGTVTCNTASEVPKITSMPTHDISNREAKIDEAMMGEEF